MNNHLKQKVLLAMSGGTDSSVSAMLLQDQGFEVIGIHFSFFDESWALPHVMEQQFQAQKNASQLCEKLKIEFYELSATEEFYTFVIQYFTKEYFEGKTPFPCAVCNPKLKWKLLFDKALELKCDFIATGHYVSIEDCENTLYITQSIDPDKDQSFFLWGLSQEILRKTLFPLAGKIKTDVRAFAAERGFDSVSKRKDSLGVCFLGNDNYRPFVEKELAKQGIVISEGEHISSNGDFLGKNQGYLHYTIGQRKNLGIHVNDRIFVKEILPKSNQVVLSKYEELYKTEFLIHNYYFHNLKDAENELIVKIRYRKQATPCRVQIINETTMNVILLEPLESIAPGQTAVFYIGARVVGGGFIS